MPYLFSYGTLQQTDVQMASFGRMLEGKPDALPGWRREMVEITDAEVLAKSGERFHPILVPGGEADEIPGMVFEISEAELLRADAYEVSDYKRIAARLKSGVEAFVYVKA
jgi:Gamma-glutamyl cyclotransferase, AIG2-like